MADAEGTDYRTAGMSSKPDFFIVGAPKCGTTALFRYLAAHPAVFIPELKQPNYFSPEFDWYGHVATLPLFSSAHAHVLTGEVSTAASTTAGTHGTTARSTCGKRLARPAVPEFLMTMLRRPCQSKHCLSM